MCVCVCTVTTTSTPSTSPMSRACLTPPGTPGPPALAQRRPLPRAGRGVAPPRDTALPSRVGAITRHRPQRIPPGATPVLLRPGRSKLTAAESVHAPLLRGSPRCPVLRCRPSVGAATASRLLARLPPSGHRPIPALLASGGPCPPGRADCHAPCLRWTRPWTSALHAQPASSRGVRCSWRCGGPCARPRQRAEGDWPQTDIAPLSERPHPLSWGPGERASRPRGRERGMAALALLDCCRACWCLAFTRPRTSLPPAPSDGTVSGVNAGAGRSAPSPSP